MRLNRKTSLLPDGPLNEDQGYTKEGGLKESAFWSLGSDKWSVIQRIRFGPVIRVLLQVLFVLFLMSGLYDKFSFTDNDDSRFQHLRNHFCLDPVNRDLCELPNQYKQFIWVFVDSLAYDHAIDLINTFDDHSNLFKIMNHGFKFSTAIYTTFFTGKVPTNYAGHEIMSDNLFYQFQKAGFKVQYAGPKFPTSFLLGSERHGYFSKEVFVADEDKVLDFLQSNIYNSYFDDAARKGASMMFTTNYLDDKVHRTGKKDPANYAMVKALQPIMEKLKQFIDRNPEYLLILNSDHGGSLSGGKHEGQLHGVPDGGNEAWMLFYNPNLVPLSKKNIWIDNVDVCGTVASYFSSVSIPTESVGIASASTDSIEHLWKVRKLNAMQIKALADLKKFPYDEDEYRTAISESDLSVGVDKMGRFIRSIKDPLIDFKRFPLTELISVGAMVLVYQLIIILQDFSSIVELILAIRANAVAIILPFFFLYYDMSFLKFDYFVTNFLWTFSTYSVVIGATFLFCAHQLAVHLKSGDSLPYASNDLTTTKMFDSELVLGTYSTTIATRKCSLRVALMLGYWLIVSFYFNSLDGLLFLPFLHLFNFIGLEFFLLYDCGSLSAKELKEKLSRLSHESLCTGLIVLVYFYEYIQSLFLMQTIYTIMLIYLIYGLLKDSRVVAYPVVLLLFILSLDEERFFLVFVLLPSYYVMSEAFKDLPNPYGNEIKSFLYRNPQKMILLLLINFAYSSFVQMGGEFNMNVVVRAGAIGVLNVERYPEFSGFLMAFHKLGYFFILAAFWVRIISYDRKKLDEFLAGGGNLPYFGTSVTESIWRFMVVKTLILMWTFHLAFWLYKDYLTCFIMTMITSLLTVMMGAGIVSFKSYQHFGFLTKFCVQLFNRWK